MLLGGGDKKSRGGNGVAYFCFEPGQVPDFRCRTLVLAAFLAFSTTAVFAEGICDGIQCGGAEQMCRVSSSNLPLRLLVKPDANLFEDASTDSNIIRGNIAPFSSMYVFEAANCDEDTSDPFHSPVWYKVGYTQSAPAGYMSANDAVQWRSAMTVAYTNRGSSERRRVLLFDKYGQLDLFIEAAVDGSLDVDDAYRKIEDLSEIPDGVRAIEPEAWTDIDRKVYLLPILQFEDLNHYFPEGDFRALQVAALSRSSGRSSGRGECDLTADDAEECLSRSPVSADIQAIDIIWVVDMTLSMQPYIDAVANAVRKASLALREEIADEDKIRFGLVGYRDDVEVTPELDFVSKNFTPELLNRTEFEWLMREETVKAATRSTGDFPEEVFAGVREGVKSAWRENALRVIILIGDASSHELDHHKNTSGLSLEATKSLVDEAQVYLAAILLSNPAAGADSSVAEKQYSVLSDIDGTSAYYRVPVSKSDDGSTRLQKTLRSVTADVLEFGVTGDFGKLASDDADDGVSAAIKKAVRAAAVDYLGQEADPPSNITAWAADRDLSDLEKQAFDVRVVVTRKDLQELKQVIEALLVAVREGNKSSSGFIEDTTGASASAAVDLEISDQQRFGESNLVPRWIDSLAYRSPALTISLDEFLQLPPDDRTEFEARLARLTNAYEQILSNTDAWYLLNDQDTEEGQVHLLPLRQLP